MRHLKKYKDHKKGKTKIKRVSDKSFNWIPVANKMSPSPGQTFLINKIDLNG